MQIFPCENSLTKSQQADSEAFCGVNAASRHGSSHSLCLFLFAWASGCSECGIVCVLCVFLPFSPNEVVLRNKFSAVEKVGTLSAFSAY